MRVGHQTILPAHTPVRHDAQHATQGAGRADALVSVCLRSETGLLAVRDRIACGYRPTAGIEGNRW